MTLLAVRAAHPCSRGGSVLKPAKALASFSSLQLISRLSPAPVRRTWVEPAHQLTYPLSSARVLCDLHHICACAFSARATVTGVLSSVSQPQGFVVASGWQGDRLSLTQRDILGE